MELNREKLKRMFEDTKGTGGSTNSGGGGGALAGYATQAWVNEGFVSIEFFNRLFTAYGPGATSSDPDVAVEPNDLDSTITNIKAMFGLWTEQYLSALGLNPGGTGTATSLGMLDDVYITTPTNGQALVYNATSLKWENQTISTVTALANLTDVLLTSPANHEFLMYDGAKWINSAIKTINGQTLYGSGDISVGGGASGNYLPLSGGTLYNTIADSWVLAVNATNGGNISSLFLGDTYGNGFWCGTTRTDTSHYLFNVRNGIARHGSGGNSVLYVRADGYIGVGNESPERMLDVAGDIYTQYVGFRGNNGTRAGWVGRGSSSNNNITLYSENNITLSIGGHTCLYTEQSHYVGINTNIPRAPLDVNGYIHTDYVGFVGTDEVSRVGWVGRGSLSHNDITLKSDTNLVLSVYDGTAMYISSNRNVGIGTTSPSYTLHVSGSIYATGEITALSDIRQKNIQEYMQLGIDEVANAPVIKFTWKDPKAEDKGLQVGSIAQYWEKVLPEAVKRDKEGTLSMSYGVVALVAAISTAKKVQEHERRIADLECENKKLKGQLIRLNRYG